MDEPVAHSRTRMRFIGYYMDGAIIIAMIIFGGGFLAWRVWPSGFLDLPVSQWTLMVLGRVCASSFLWLMSSITFFGALSALSEQVRRLHRKPPR